MSLCMKVQLYKEGIIKNDYNCVTKDDDTSSFEISYSENSMYKYSNKFMVSWWVNVSYLILEKSKKVILKILFLRMVRQDQLKTE